jgi:hypothetical protein
VLSESVMRTMPMGRTVPDGEARDALAAEMAGRLIGVALAPAFAAGTRLRRARVLHAAGVLCRATVTSAASSGGALQVADRLVGPALVRFSSALWQRGQEWPDVLGCAIRFGTGDPASPQGDQDSLLSTVRTPWTLPVAPLSTSTHDFLANDYYGVAPFDVPPLGRVLLRAVHPRVASAGAQRMERLRRAVSAGTAALTLQSRCRHGWEPLVHVRLDDVLEGAAAPHFEPFRDGRGIRPRGFVHALRRAVYPASRVAAREV